MKEGLRKRLAESLEAASQLAEGLVEVELLDDGGAKRVTERRRRARGQGPQRAERRQARRGPGVQREVRLPQLRRLDARARAADLLLQLPARLLPALPRARLPAGDRSRADRPRPDALDLRGRARAVDGAASIYHRRLLEAVAEANGIDVDRPWRDLPERDRELLLEGTGDERHTISYRNRFGRQRTLHGAASTGMLHSLQRRYENTDSETTRERIEGADGAAAVPGLRRRPAAAREPRGHRRRAQHLRVHAAVGAARRSSGSRRSS